MRSVIGAALIGLALTTGASSQQILSEDDVVRIVRDSGYNNIRVTNALVGRSLKITTKVFMVDATGILPPRNTSSEVNAVCKLRPNQSNLAEKLNVGDVVTFVGEIESVVPIKGYIGVFLYPCRL